jgi:hypothetical protein
MPETVEIEMPELKNSILVQICVFGVCFADKTCKIKQGNIAVVRSK